MRYLSIYIFGVLVALLIPQKSISQKLQVNNITKAYQTLNKTGELFFAIPSASTLDLDEVSRFISIERIKQDTAYCWANMSGFNNLLSMGHIVIYLDQPVFPDPMLNMAPNLDSIFNWNVYPTWEQYDSLMHYFAATYNSICHLESIGESVDHRNLYVIKISDNVLADEAEPNVMFSSSIHGNEITGYVMMLELIDYLLKNYETDSKINSIINNTVIWINPLHNPDGTYHSGNSSIAGATRLNKNGVDLNRNFPDPAGGDHPDGNEWQPETVAFMNFMKSHRISISANFHGGSEVVNYPWDTWPRLHPDNDWFIQISKNYTHTLFNNRIDNSYFTDFPDGITNGYAWYRITGGLQDYASYFEQNRQVTIEISNTMMPESNTLPNYWTANYNSFINYIDEVSHCLKGDVIDANTRQPVAAQIFISDHDKDNSWIYSDSINGMFYRLLSDGNYNLSISAPGYITEHYYNLSFSYVSGYDIGIIELKPISQPEITFTNSTITIALNAITTKRIKIEIFDIQGKVVNPNVYETIPPGPTSVVVNIDYLNTGIYLCKIAIDGSVSTYKIPHFKL